MVAVLIAVAGLSPYARIETHEATNRSTTDWKHAVSAEILARDSTEIQNHLNDEQHRIEAGGPGVMTPMQVVGILHLLQEIDAISTAVAPTDDGGEFATMAQRLTETADRYFQTQERADLDAFRATVFEFEQLSEAMARDKQGQATAHTNDLDRLFVRSAWAWVGAMVVGTLAVGLSTLVIGRRSSRASACAATERAALVRSNAILDRRNGQFQALYHVATEVTETTSLKYVVETAVREAKALVDADLVVLRVLRESRLVVAGIANNPGVDVSELGDVELGTGISGRVARRGKTFRIDGGAAGKTASREGTQGLESVLSVPLIVGARVVGTLACGSLRPNAFSADDEQVLEMMGTQVAAAVRSADEQEATTYLASHDALTGLPNRRQLMKDVNERMSQLVESDVPVAVAMIDVDHFKAFNDEFGHNAGDIVLQRVAEVLRDGLRGADRIYRYGGEEFVVLLEGVESEQAADLVDRLRALVERTETHYQGVALGRGVTISAGVASVPADADDFERALKLADAALYDAKRAGRNRVCNYFADVDQAAADKPLPAAA